MDSQYLGQFKSTFLLGLTSLTIVLPFYLSLPILLLVLILLMVRQRARLLREWRDLGPWGAFCLYVMGVSAFYQNWAGLAVGLGFFLLAIYFKIFHYYLNESFYRLNLKVIAFGSLFASLYSQLAYGLFIWQESLSWEYILVASSPRFRAESMFFNANYYGLFCLFAFLIALYLLKTTDKCLGRLFYVAVLVANFLGLILTASRMVWPALLMGLLVFALVVRPRSVLGLGLIGLLAVVGLTLRPDLLPRFNQLLYGFEDRFILWRAGWQIFMLSPLTGRGPLNFMKYYHLVNAKATTHSHQLLIDTLASYGLYGLFFLWVTLLPYFRRLMERSRQADPYQVGLVLGILAMILTHGLTDVSLLWHQTLYVALVALYPPFMQKISTQAK